MAENKDEIMDEITYELTYEVEILKFIVDGVFMVGLVSGISYFGTMSPIKSLTIVSATLAASGLYRLCTSQKNI